MMNKTLPSPISSLVGETNVEIAEKIVDRVEVAQRKEALTAGKVRPVIETEKRSHLSIFRHLIHPHK